jgi:hypothetical protein
VCGDPKGVRLLFRYGRGRVGGVRAVGVKVFVGMGVSVGVMVEDGKLVTVETVVGIPVGEIQAARLAAIRLNVK